MPNHETRFFKYCPQCRKYFLSPELWKEHMHKHDPNYNADAITAKTEPTVINQYKHLEIGDKAYDEDAWFERTKKLRNIKNKLYELGYECQTLNEQDTISLYEQAKKAGKL